ncbi:periplasmic protein [Blastopirellula marina DSM 3645]|uniref:Periplasmic protein n=1 Tax=Blastopirellula marina DSM 3645 TaxID=314230 RepID=A3ZT66_9BACT|nr:periplasmic protein [Blastopirellula marina DSM 3645]
MLLGVLATTMIITRSVVAETGPPVRDSQRSFYAYARNWRDIRDQNIVKQRRDYSCGAAALATISQYYWGDGVTEQKILNVLEENLTQEQLLERVQNGLAISDLRMAAVKVGYLSTIGRITPEELTKVKLPVIVALKLEESNHFVVVRGVVNGWVYLADPARGNLRMPLGQFADIWIENAVLVVAKRGEVLSKKSRLGITMAEVNRGWLNNQVLRTAPEKTFKY